MSWRTLESDRKSRQHGHFLLQLKKRKTAERDSLFLDMCSSYAEKKPLRLSLRVDSSKGVFAAGVPVVFRRKISSKMTIQASSALSIHRSTSLSA